MAETKNQSEGEFFAVATTGRKGLEDMADKMGGEIMAIAAQPVKEAGSTWMKRAIVAIANNDNLKDVISTKTGLFSVYKSLAKAATMGLQIGGQFPHAHLTPYQGKVELIVSAEGYKHAAVNGPGAVLSMVDIRRVYEGEQVRIDVGAAKVDHVIDVTKDRGKLIGIYGIITRTNGSRAVDYMSKAEALAIRDSHSSAYRNGKGPWKTDEDAMVEKTAAKKFLRKYAAEAEGLAMLFGQDNDEPEAYDPPPRDIGERMAGQLDAKAEKTAAAPVKAAKPTKEAKEPETIQGTAEAVQEDAKAESGEPAVELF